LKVLPELIAYRDRLMTKAADWPDQPVEDLIAALGRCREQMRLLESALADLRAHPAKVGEPAGEDPRREHRISVQEQTRQLTAAYAEALRRHLDGRAVRG